MNLIFRISKMLFLLLLLVICAGCVSGIMTLKRYSASQDEIERYIEKQEKGFLELKRDLEKNALKKGSRKKRIIARYGDPVYCRDLEDPADPEISESCLYREPTNYFSTDKVYLYFNHKQALHSWEHRAAGQ